MSNCIVHYCAQKKYTALKFKSDANEKKKILEPKEIRFSIVDENHHREQCQKIPLQTDKINHKIHRKCYKILQ